VLDTESRVLFFRFLLEFIPQCDAGQI